MAFSCGFWNSKDGDRMYDSVDFSHLFDGIINDGIFMSVGTGFSVLANGGMQVSVGVGRYWFNSTWGYNDALMPLDGQQSEIIQDRYDCVVIDIDSSDGVRNGEIIFVQGKPAAVGKAVPPEMILDDVAKHWQYPLCNILVGKGVTEITQENITSLIGTGSTPFVTGILETMDISALVAQWQANWAKWVAGQGQAFADWFTALQIELSGNVAGNLQAQIDVFNYGLMGFVASTISFPNGTIVMEFTNGYKQVVEFIGGEIITTYREGTTGTILRTLTTTFNSDGTITSTLAPSDSAIPPINPGNFAYAELSGLPKIGGVTLVGDLTPEDIGTQPLMTSMSDAVIDEIVNGG